MKNILKNRFVNIAFLVICAIFLRFYLEGFIEEENGLWLRMTSIIIILTFGGFVWKIISFPVFECLHLPNPGSKSNNC